MAGGKCLRCWHLDIRDKGFNYLRQSFPDQDAFSEWLEKAQELSLYDTGVADFYNRLYPDSFYLRPFPLPGQRALCPSAVHRGQAIKNGGTIWNRKRS